jgi:hypothetical protein
MYAQLCAAPTSRRTHASCDRLAAETRAQIAEQERDTLRHKLAERDAMIEERNAQTAARDAIIQDLRSEDPLVLLRALSTTRNSRRLTPIMASLGWQPSTNIPNSNGKRQRGYVRAREPNLHPTLTRRRRPGRSAR